MAGFVTIVLAILALGFGALQMTKAHSTDFRVARLCFWTAGLISAIAYYNWLRHQALTDRVYIAIAFISTLLIGYFISLLLNWVTARERLECEPLASRADVAALIDFKVHRDKGEQILAAIRSGDALSTKKLNQMDEWWADAQTKAHQSVFEPFLTLGELNRFKEPWPEGEKLEQCAQAIHNRQITDEEKDVMIYGTHWERLERVRQLIGLIEWKARV